MTESDRPPTPTTVLADALAAVEARVGYLRAATEAPPDDGWIPCADLVGGGSTLHDLVAETAPGRGAPTMAVAASLFVQSYAFRVGGVALAATALGLGVPSTRPEDTAIKLTRHRPGAIAHLSPILGEPSIDRVAAELLDDHLAPLVESLHAAFTIGDRLLWGNVAASCVTALRALEGAVTDDERPGVRATAEAFLAAGGDRLGGLGDFHVIRVDAAEGWFWSRTSCCLWYQTTDGPTCDDCSLLDPSARDEAWRKVVAGVEA